jgi:Protein of unknown function (DUF935)
VPDGPPIDTGSGPPKGSPYDSPWAKPLPVQDRRPAIERMVGGTKEPYGRDPGFQPPTPLLDDGTRSRTRLVRRDVPLVTIQNNWSIQEARHALYAHMIGQFESSSQLVDSQLGDDRVQATLGSRIGGLFGRSTKHKPAQKSRVRGSQAAQECLDAWLDHWPTLHEDYALTESAAYGIFMGFAHGQVLWDTSEWPWKPYPRPWHPRYEWYEWVSRKYVAISQDGNFPIIPGDGSWYGFEPFGSYRAWIRGAVRAVTEPWMGRHFGFRDWFGFSELHGFPIRKCYVPAAADAGERANYEQQVAALGSNTTLLIPRAVDKDTGYDFELEEAGDTAWESFPGLIDRCDLAIVLAIKFQNLTTEITSSGSYAAAREHGKVDVSQVKADGVAWRNTIYRDFARPFAFLNFGDADLAPISEWDVPEPPREDHAEHADQFYKVGMALQAMATAGVRFRNADEARDWFRDRMGLRDMPSFDLAEPTAPSITVGGPSGAPGGSNGQ